MDTSLRRNRGNGRRRGAAAAVAATLVLGVLGAGGAAAQGGVVTSGVGLIERDGGHMVVEVLVRVASQEDAGAIADAALRRLGARPLRESPQQAFALPIFGEVRWPQFDEAPRKRNAVPVAYNPAGEPSPAAGPAVAAALSTWSAVKSSAFGFAYEGTTDRCPSIFCAGDLDGANDVGWLDLGDEAVLGFAGFFFVFDTGEILEADVVLNPGARPWTADGTGYDLETVALHELGHVAGLAHVWDDHAVMFPFINRGEIKRELTQSESDGISYLYPKAAHPRPGHPLPPALPIRADVVAALGDAAPGGGVLDFNFELGELSDSGHLAFVTDVVSGGSSTGQVVLRAGPAGIEELARTGWTSPSGGTLGLGTLGPVALSPTGTAAFAFLTDRLRFPFGRNGSVFRSGVGAGLEELATANVTTAGDHGVLRGALDADVADDGRVVFSGLVDAPGIPSPGAFFAQGVFEVGAAGLHAVAAPGGGFDFAAHPTTNAAGEVAFDGQETGTPCFRPRFVLFGCHGGVYRTAGIDEVAPLARPGDPAPDGRRGHLLTATGPVLNELGDVLYAGELIGTGSVHQVVEALYLHRQGATRQVVGTGDPLPNGSHVDRRLLRPSERGRPHWTLNDRGDAAFVAPLTDSVFGDGLVSNGVYLHRNGRLRLVARSGTPVLGLGTIRAIGTLVVLPPEPEDPAPGFFISGGVALNDAGDISFPATLTDGRIVLLRTRI